MCSPNAIGTSTSGPVATSAPASTNQLKRAMSLAPSRSVDPDPGKVDGPGLQDVVAFDGLIGPRVRSRRPIQELEDEIHRERDVGPLSLHGALENEDPELLVVLAVEVERRDRQREAVAVDLPGDDEVARSRRDRERPVGLERHRERSAGDPALRERVIRR